MNKFKWFKKFIKDDFTDKLYFGDDTINVFKENSNYLIVGPNGSGKNLNFFTPNIINQKNNSIVSLDFDKRLYNKCKKSLEDNGYKVYYLDSENFFDNIFFHSKVFVGIKTSDNDEITETLNKFYDIKDEDDYYSNIEISLLRAIAKELLLDRKSIFIRDIFSFWSNLDFDDIEKSFKHFEDEYINEHLDDFISFTKDIGLKGFKFLKEKITKKFIEDENDLNNFNFNILRDEKIALFFETSSHYHNDIYLSPLIRVLFNQIISKFEGLKISIFLDDFCCLKDFDMLKEILFLSRGRNYLLYIGIQNFQQLNHYLKISFYDVIHLLHVFIVFASNNSSTMKYFEVLDILRIKDRPSRLEVLKDKECILHNLNTDGEFDSKIVKFKNDKLFKIINN